MIGSKKNNENNTYDYDYNLLFIENDYIIIIKLHINYEIKK